MDTCPAPQLLPGAARTSEQLKNRTVSPQAAHFRGVRAGGTEGRKQCVAPSLVLQACADLLCLLCQAPLNMQVALPLNSVAHKSQELLCNR